ncbi:MBL fold metallo-hydrolase [Litoreibacter roseus]|uniref:Phosphoribosyl 1,2-cyclic phosphodiesterase n=1 Tax=Litoreibacter roseus TaxID=2601869 RepID=A0A6N6JGU4_9RHOB|nr:MBL fold metallo-hydrolase [Litoreibacter roseus]GFE65344.1 phosphoribosyl 1,2-cyclic phosphodiesterase [Litoreibacter roseus]
MKQRFTILGCGSSGGVPRLGDHWGDCDPENPKNRRRRCSLLIEQIGPDGTTTVLIDTSPDLRAQLLDTGTGRLDGVVYTHSHADHVHGIDDLRMIVFNMRERLDIWADGPTQDALLSRFGYVFVQPEGSPYPPILNLNTIDGDVKIDGAGGVLTLSPFKAGHGSIDALGFRVGNVAYLPDAETLYDHTRDALANLDWFIIDALRRTPHPSHSHLDNTLQWIEDLQPKRAVITNMHIDLDYDTVEAETPAHVTPAFDGLIIEVDL